MTANIKEYPTTPDLVGELSFDTLLDLSFGKVSCSQKRLALNNAVQNSSLHKLAFQGLNAFLKKKSPEKLAEIITKGIQGNIKQAIFIQKK